MANADDDDIGLEALQAQIDMSMAFTQNLVSSWMGSSKGKLPSSKSHRDEERELEEYMRRPPRLGVGAASPESTSMFGRDTARLKNKLTGTAGKKRSREVDNDVVGVPSDDEDESRASAIKKKARVDVFGKRVKAKKDKQDGCVSSHAPKNEATASSSKRVDDSQATKAQKTPEIAASKGDKRDKQVTRNVSLHHSPRKEAEANQSSADQSIIDPSNSLAPSSSKYTKPHTTAISKEPSNDYIANISSELNKDSKSPPSEVNVSSVTTLSKVSSKPAGITEVPLLNLQGPPQEIADESPTSPKKKRRRKKKKKKVVVDTEAAKNGDESD